MSATTEREILALEQDLTRATERLDVDTLDRLYAEAYLATGANGEAGCAKATIMDELRRGIEERKNAPAGAEVTYEKDDLKIAVHGDTAITHYRFSVTAKIPGREEPISNRFRTTNVWMKRSGTWQVVGGHTSRMAD